MIRLIIILLLFSTKIYAASQDSLHTEPQRKILQELQLQKENGGHARIVSSQAIDNLLNLHIQQNKKNKTFSGYRIQIYSSSSNNSNIDQLKQMRDDFENEFLDIPAYLKYFDPDFKIRAGNFHSRLECIPALYRIRKKFPASYPVKTDISLEELKRQPLIDRPVIETETTTIDME